MTPISYFCIISLYFYHSFAITSHWNRVLPRICTKTTADRNYKALLDCDQLMDSEAKEIFDYCVNEVTGAEVDPKRPRICYYSRQGQQLDSCKSTRYNERNLSIKQVINKEIKHTWCVMKIAQPLGWEKLCAPNLPPNRKAAVRRCDNSFRDITSPVSQCYVQMNGQQNDGRPIACRSFEYSIELWECLEKRAQQRSNANKVKELELKAERYLICLKRI